MRAQSVFFCLGLWFVCAICTDCNKQDRATIHSDADLHKQLEKCARKCLMKDEGCELQCVTESVGISPECSVCFADDIKCSMLHCKLECLFNSRSSKCLTCHKTFCEEDLISCTGMTIAELPT
ncbi:hypothetical protein Pelo_15423 [Pelomyxa schiedti]|nr:hypothetical protein Pelo_15423 [Pelomyxa schiedti]